MRDLVSIDNGNSNPNVGIHIKGELKDVLLYSDYKKLENHFESFERITSSVGQDNFIEGLDIKTLRKEKSFLDMPINYSMTLGMDRVAAAYYVYKILLTENKKALVIDAGTFMTVDLISKEEGFCGGHIFPGTKVFLESYTKGAKLPLLEQDENPQLEIPHSTEEAITEALKVYLNSTVLSLTKKYNIDMTVISGGSADYVCKFIEGKLVRVDHIVHRGLSIVLNSYS